MATEKDPQPKARRNSRAHQKGRAKKLARRSACRMRSRSGERFRALRMCASALLNRAIKRLTERPASTWPSGNRCRSSS